MSNLAPVPRMPIGALVCATVAFVVVIGGFVTLVILAPAQADNYIRPLIPTFASLGAAALLWYRTSHAQAQGTAENAEIARRAAAAVSAAQAGQETVSKRLNGELDGRIKAAVSAAILEAQPIVTTPETDTKGDN